MSRFYARFVFALLLLPSAVTAGTGSEWLKSQILAGGAYDSPGNTATAFQSTAETLLSLGLLDGLPADTSDSRQFLTSHLSDNTETLSRKIIALTQAGEDTSALLNTLIGHRNDDGGFGDNPGYASTVLDTAFALEALAAGGLSADVAALAGLSIRYLLDAQQSDGSWLNNSRYALNRILQFS